MRNHNQHVSGIKSPTKVCGVETMEARTLLSADGFHPGHSLHVVAPFDIPVAAAFEHNSRTQSHERVDKVSTTHVLGMPVTEVVIIRDGMVVITADAMDTSDDAVHTGGYWHGDDDGGKAPRAIPGDTSEEGYQSPNRGNWHFPTWAGFVVRGSRGDSRGDDGTPATDTSSATSANSGRQVLSVAPALPPGKTAAVTDAAPVRVASAPVAKAIFSSEPVRTQVNQTNVSSSYNPQNPPASASTGINDLTGRSVILYLSLLTGNTQPAWLEAKAVTAQVVTETVVTASQEGIAAAMSAALHALPAPQQAAEIVRLGSPFMLIADSIGSFIEESAQIPALTNPATRPHRAWSVTAAVIAADLLLLAYCYRSRREREVSV